MLAKRGGRIALIGGYINVVGNHNRRMSEHLRPDFVRYTGAEKPSRERAPEAEEGRVRNTGRLADGG